MNNYNQQISFKVLASIILISLSFWSCADFLNAPTPEGQLGSTHLFDDENTLQSALRGTYASFSFGPTTSFTAPSLFADELTSTQTSDTYAQSNTYTVDQDLYFFNNYYNTIYQVNLILDGIDNSPKISAGLRNQVKGECLFIRAFCHFQLTNFYGEVPYITVTDPNVTAFLPKAPKETIYKGIISDLKTASGLLTNNYPTNNDSTQAIDPRTRANKQVVNTLLAKAYLYSEDWARADSTATEVIDSKLYTLNTSPTTVFVKTSKETIWQHWNTTGSTIGSLYVPVSTATVVYAARDTLVKSFDPVNNNGETDLRFKAWLKAGTAASASLYYPFKYKVKSSSGNEYLIRFRLAELYLIRSEARAHLDDVANGLLDLDVIRGRAGFITPTTGITTSAQLLDAVALERKKELMFEAGNRWFDLNRRGQAVNVLSKIKPGFDEHVTVLPFPRAALNGNPNLINNPGYSF